MELIPIIIPQIDYTLFIESVHSLIGKDVGRALDSKNVKTHSLPGFLQLMDELSIGAYSHLHFTFLLIAEQDVIFDMLIQSGLTWSTMRDQRDIVIVSGSLSMWLSAMQTHCVSGVVREVREIYNRAQYFFEQAGFNIFPPKHSLSDGTYTW